MEPIPTTNHYVIVRFDMYHTEGVLEGVYVDIEPALAYLKALRETAKDTSSFFHAVRAAFKLFEVRDD